LARKMAAPVTPAELREKADHYRTLALAIFDPRTVEALRSLAAEYEALAEKLEKDTKPENR
jgi:hypothetical protein